MLKTRRCEGERRHDTWRGNACCRPEGEKKHKGMVQGEEMLVVDRKVRRSTGIIECFAVGAKREVGRGETAGSTR